MTPRAFPHSFPLPAGVRAGLLAALLSAAPAHADGVPLDPAPVEAQSRPAVASDRRGGAVVSFKTASLKLGAVHVDGDGHADGALGFAPLALPLGLEANEPVRVAPGDGVRVRFVADRSATAQPVVASLEADGSATAGFPVGLPFPLVHPEVVESTEGRTLLLAKNSDAQSFWTLRAAMVAADASVVFAVQLQSPLQFFNSDRMSATSDGAGGAIAIVPYYEPFSTGSKDLGIFRIAADGSRPWAEQVIPYIVAGNDQYDVHTVTDGAGGAIFAWTDLRSSLNSADIYVMRVTADGQRPEDWGFYGTPLASGPGAQTEPRLTPDGTGGAWLVWRDQANDAAGDLRYSHVLASGSVDPAFPATGRVLCAAAGAQREAVLANDGAGGCFFAWTDERSGNADLYAQHVLPNGDLAPGWDPAGRAVSIAPGDQDQPALGSVRAGRAVLAWRDARTTPARIYASAVVEPGTVSVPAPPARLALTVQRPRGRVLVCDVSLAGAEPAALELLDVAGRRLDAADLPAGSPRARAELRAPAASGLCFVRLRQGGAQCVRRVPVVR